MKAFIRFLILFFAASVAAFAADTTRPEITGAFVAPNGTTMTFQFSEPVVIGSGGSDGFRVVPSGDGAATLSYTSGSGSRVLVYTLSRTILAGEDLRLSYNQPDDGVEDLAGNDLAHQSVYRRRAGLPMQYAPMVNNNSTQIAPETTAPTLASATIGADGETFTMVFSETVAVGSGGNGGFVPTLSSGTPTLTYASGSGSDTLVYMLSSTVIDSTTGTLSYTQPGNGIEDAVGNDLASFSGVVITNSSTQTGAGNPDLLWWKLNDASGSTIVADVGPGSTTSTGTLNGDYLAMSAANTAFGSSSDIAWGADVVTVSFWIKAGAWDTTGPLFRSVHINTPPNWEVYVSLGKLTGRMAGATGARWEYHATPPAVGTWTHCAIVFDNSTAAGDIKIYLNGVEKTTTIETDTKTGTGNFTTGTFHMKSIFNDAAVFDVDDIRVYSGELASGDVSAIYSGGRQ